VYWEFAFAPDSLGVAVGTFTDPAFPPPVGSGFEAYGAPWVMKLISDLQMPHFEYEGPSHGVPRA
jgi:hypothetical protein